MKPDKHSTRAVAIWLFPRTLFGRSSLDLTSNQLQQLPAIVFSSMTSLRSHLCGCMKWNVCMLGDENNQIQIRSLSSSKHKSQAGSGTLRWRMMSCLRVPMIFSTFSFDTSICIFSTCLRSHVYYIWCSCIFITVFDFRRYTRQLETKLDFKA